VLEIDKRAYRDLHMDQYCLLVLLWMFPLLTSMRALQKADERAVMARTVESDRCYLVDRGYAKFLLWNVIHTAQSSYICRVRDNSVYEVIEEKPLTAADRKAGVISDQIVKFTGSKADALPDHSVRLVIVSASEHTSRGSSATGSSTGPSCDGKLRLATDLLEISAELIAEGYRVSAVTQSLHVVNAFEKASTYCI